MEVHCVLFGFRRLVFLINMVGFLYLVVSFFLWLCLFVIGSPIIFQLYLVRMRVLDLAGFMVYVDYYRVLYLFVLGAIVGRIHFFLCYYLGSDLKLNRFVVVLKLFVFSMVVLIIAPNLVFIVLGWDGLGFTSFILVAWFGCSFSRSARVKTFLTNRLGDGFFLVFLVYFFFQGHFKFFIYDQVLLLVGLGLLVVFYTKRAHFPFRSWLPDAMAAPTPVSALVHSSTLVTAGLYMLFRFSYIWRADINVIIHGLGLWTLFLGRLGACFDQKSKKVVAYSTIRQLGLLRFIISLGLYDLFFYYMMVHALFKALLFISVGSLMLVSGHNQDMRHLGKCWFQNPLVSLRLFFRVFSLSGFPFFSGFYIKELVVNGSGLINCKLFSNVLFYCSILFTVYYSFRLYKRLLSSYGYNYGVIAESVYLPSWLFLILYVSVFQVGVVLYNRFFCWLNLGSSELVLFISVVGVVISLYFVLSFRSYYVVGWLVDYRVYMFYLNLITLRFKNIMVVGRYFYEVVDKGFYLFVFINKINSLFRVRINVIFRNQFFLNWLFLLVLSFGFVLLVVLF